MKETELDAYVRERRSAEPEISLAAIEGGAKRFAADRRDLADRVATLNEGVESLKRAALPGIKRAVAKAAESQLDLAGLVERGRHLFQRPRTVIFHGIKVGLHKGTGRIEWDDDDQVVRLIEKHFSKAQADLLIKTVRKPIRKALADLDVKMLKMLGCRVSEVGDCVVIEDTASEVDKMVGALLAAEVETLQEETEGTES